MEDDIYDVIIKTLCLATPQLKHLMLSCQPHDTENSMCFQILGFDILIERRKKNKQWVLSPSLLEINQMPSFATGSPFDYELKKSLIVDSLKLLCMTPARRKMLRDERREMYAKRLTTNTKSMNAAQIAALQKEAGGAELPAKSGPGELERRIKALLKKKEKNEREAKRK